MCLIAFAIQASSQWPLVIASNRDEFLARPTQPLGWWTSGAGQPILSGRDLQAGGTWMGLTPQGRVAFVTNVREAKVQAAPRSRGELVTRWLESRSDSGDFLAALQAEAEAYAGFNLVLGDFQSQSWMWASNRSNTGHGWQAQRLTPGIYGLSNAQLDTPWPKTLQLKHVLTQTLAQAVAPKPKALQTPLWAALANRERAQTVQLPTTGVPAAFEAALSSAFVEFPEHGYGTRSSTLLLASPQGAAHAPGDWAIQLEEKTYSRGSASPEPALLQSAQTVWHAAA